MTPVWTLFRTLPTGRHRIPINSEDPLWQLVKWKFELTLRLLCWIQIRTKLDQYTGFEISLVRSSETSKNDSRTSGIPAGQLVRRTTAYFWFSRKLHWLYIFQTSEWYIQTSDFKIHLPDEKVHTIRKFEAWYDCWCPGSLCLQGM